MFSQLTTKQTRNSLVKFLFSHKKTFSFHNINKESSSLTSTFIPGKQGYDKTNFSPPSPPKKPNKATKQESRGTTIIRVSGNTITGHKKSIEEESAKKKGNRDITPPKLDSKLSYKFDDKKRFKNELKLKRFEYSLELGSAQQSIDNNNNKINKLKQSREELGLKQRKKEWYEKIKQHRQGKLDKINETIKILSLSSNPEEFFNDEYREMKRVKALENYRKQELEKCRKRRLNLLTLYYNSSDFVTLNNLDTKVADMYNEVRQPFTTTLEDMQIDYLEGGGIVDDLELKRRLDIIKDTLNDTAQGGKQKLGLDKIEKYVTKEPNIEIEANLVQSLDS
ncbi:hypothetical protein C1645_835563 [Glomus cerebriforme]|uniref:Uncharacterized protein n=1 Tax=Glomus cerebriforme TaxID=658196 RepID=A0A397SHP2_9GLOM|nr:hypothetical protein C1645_835563 [Glomus cerebriforme]